MFFERHGGGERAVLVHLEGQEPAVREDPEEFQELARSAGAQMAAFVSVPRQQLTARYLIGSGKVDELAQLVKACEAELVIFNYSLTPSQERNLERAFECRVLDRTGLILDIFAQRARTHEGKLQVELAQLEHMSTRLVRGWTHLERQKGGIGLRGPGETQLETDRRLLQKRVEQLQRRLEKVEVQHTQMRRARVRSELPRVALVGYTNAGKSTLFNALSGAEAYAADQLFATLDPTVRRVALPGGGIVLADTVGFVRDLPHELVAAFRSTLSEAREADLLLHVVDAADPLREDRIAQVDAVLAEVGAGDLPQLLVFNKIDRIDGAQPRHDVPGEARERVWLSARDGRGLDLLHEALALRLGLTRIGGELRLSPQQGKLRARLHALQAVRGEIGDEHGWRIQVDLPRADAERLVVQPEGEPLRALLPAAPVREPWEERD